MVKMKQLNSYFKKLPCLKHIAMTVKIQKKIIKKAVLVSETNTFKKHRHKAVIELILQTYSAFVCYVSEIRQL